MRARWNDGARDETNTFFSSRYSIVSKLYEPLLIYTHYIITIFSLFAICVRFLFIFAFCCCVVPALWLLVKSECARVWWQQRHRRHPAFFIPARQRSPFYLSFSFILFYSRVFFSLLFFGCHIYSKLWREHNDGRDQRKQKKSSKRTSMIVEEEKNQRKICETYLILWTIK